MEREDEVKMKDRIVRVREKRRKRESKRGRRGRGRIDYAVLELPAVSRAKTEGDGATLAGWTGQTRRKIYSIRVWYI